MTDKELIKLAYQQVKAMQQALEALKESIDVPCYGGHPKQEAAYHALQKALANEALDKKAENARELGLDYEPPQRLWVGLTDEEISKEVKTELTHYWNGEYIDTTGACDQLTAFARAIEAAIRSKNA